ncbi:HzNVORF124-like protein [Microplitis demolitor]|uniref:uncharacterized LOC103568979 n=1 Tax=Microplitis demolitor TaxID=69319 RepID=UPI0004CDA806|nr:uncharacterized LOC103568979 [Microplitis demolitor]KAG6558434.1 HzNVORF124-like protein [Microplitis demolitor]
MNRLSASNIGSKIQSAVKKVSLTPECEGLGSSLSISGLIHLGLAVISFILLIVVIGIHYSGKLTDKEGDIYFWTIVASSALSGLSLLVGVWQHFVAKKINACISGGPSE